jgi:hypothetical protein
VRDHQPEPVELLRGHGDPELRYVAGEKGADELLPPAQAGLVGLGQERRGKSAPQPQRVEPIDADFRGVEAREVHEADTSGQRLGHAFHEVERGAAEDEESGRLEGAERLPGRFEAGEVERVFEVEVRLGTGSQRSGESRLPALARAQESPFANERPRAHAVDLAELRALADSAARPVFALPMRASPKGSFPEARRFPRLFTT